MSDSKLFTPVQLGRFTLKNRIVMAPMTRVRASLDRNITDDMVNEYLERHRKSSNDIDFFILE